MHAVQLFINDQLVDLPADAGQQLRLSKGTNSAQDIESRTADQSYTLTLPFTRRNDALFRNADIQSTGKFYSTSPFRARLEVGGRLLLSGGWRLTSIAGGYQGLVFAEEVDLFATLGERTLRDITTMAPVAFGGGFRFAELLAKTHEDGDLCWPLVAYGNFYHGAAQQQPPSAHILTPIEIDDYTPSVYYVNLMHHIFRSAGWQAAGEPLEDPYFTQLCLPHVGEEYPWNWGALLNFSAEPAPGKDLWQSMPSEVDEAGRFHRFFALQLVPGSDPAGRWRGNAYSVRRAGGYNISLEITLDALAWSHGESWSALWLEVLRVPAGAPHLEGEVVQRVAVGGAGTWTGGAVVMATWQPAFLDETDELVVALHMEESQDLGGTAQLEYQLTRFVITPAEPEVIGPMEIDVASSLPKINQREFVKSFLTLGNLRFAMDPRRRVITFYYHDRYELPADFAVELTRTADPDASEFAPATMARGFRFEYAEDTSDALGEQARALANKLLDTRNANGAGEQVLTLPFAATAMRTYRAWGEYHTLPCMASSEQLAAPLTEVQWDYGYTPRLLRYTGPSIDELELGFTGGRSVYGTASMAGLGWGELYERHYRDHVTTLVKGHLLKNRFAITPDLYQQLSARRLVLFGGILYRLNKVQGFQVADPAALAEIELLRIVQEAVGGGRPRADQEQGGREFYRGDFYSKEWY